MPTPSTVLVIGSGGREHALAWRIACGETNTPRTDRDVVVCPGNAGIAQDLRCIPNAKGGVADFVEVAKSVGADLVVIGPEQPLCDGLADALLSEGIVAVGPLAAGAQLEASKAFTKGVCAEADIATARSDIVTTKAEAEEALTTWSGQVVVKADGLCAGKGVVICDNAAEALKVCTSMLSGPLAKQFGTASTTVLLEEFLPGLELSVFALCDGERARLFAIGRDHKRLLDGDLGPNTGGMGAVAPLGEGDGVNAALYQRILNDVILPTLRVFAQRGTPYRGFLYAGLMLHNDDLKLLEYNVRFGDPEAQAVLLGTQVDLLPLLYQAATGVLDPVDLVSACRPVATVVAASEGYPEAPVKGRLVSISHPTHETRPDASTENTEGAGKIFYAGVKAQEGGLVTSGGRVLSATALGDDVKQAVENAYQLLSQVVFEGMHHRKDIGHSLVATHS